MSRNMNAGNRPPLLIREQFELIFASLTDAERGRLLSALMAYQWHGEEPSRLSEKLFGVFITLRSFADCDVQKYNRTCEQNRQKALARWEKQ